MLVCLLVWYGMAWYNGLYLLWPPFFALPLQPQQYLAAACDHLSVWGCCIPHTAPDFEITPGALRRTEFRVDVCFSAFLCAVPSSSIASSCLSQHTEDLHKCIERSPPCVPRGLGNVSRRGSQISHWTHKNFRPVPNLPCRHANDSLEIDARRPNTHTLW